MFERISSVDRPLLFLNLALLLGIGFIPWPTAVLADCIDEGAAAASTATALYSLTMTLIGLVFVAMWAHLVRHPEHTTGVTTNQLRKSRRGEPARVRRDHRPRLREPVPVPRGVRDV